MNLLILGTDDVMKVGLFETKTSWILRVPTEKCDSMREGQVNDLIVRSVDGIEFDKLNIIPTEYSYYALKAIRILVNNLITYEHVKHVDVPVKYLHY